jgi:hypothetical protein
MGNKPPTIHPHWTTSETPAIVTSELCLSLVIVESGKFDIASPGEETNAMVVISLEQPWRHSEMTFSILYDDQEIRFPLSIDDIVCCEETSKDYMIEVKEDL